MRRETFATSGTRAAVRFFQTYAAGDPCADASFPKQLTEQGAVPMGGTFKPSGQAKPRFVVAAWKDRSDLARVDVIKAWVDANDQAQEQVFSTAASSPSAVCMTWDDPSPPTGPALYYARVLEVPTPRWSVHDCAKAGVVNPQECKQGGRLNATVRERAWTSPIWFVP